jgi:hypothetical protein
MMKEPDRLGLDELEDILERKAFYLDWFNAVEALVFRAAEAGLTKKFKIVEGRSFRQWKSPILANELLAKYNIPKRAREIRKLISPAQAEKIIRANRKELAAAMKDVTFKPAGKLTLVSMSDKRDAAVGVDTDSYFEDETM